MVQVAAQVIADSLDQLPDAEGEGARARVAIITFDSELHFYAVRPDAPSVEESVEMLVVGERHLAAASGSASAMIDESFIPEDVLVPLRDFSRVLQVALLQRLPTLFQRTQRTSPVLGNALNAAAKILAGTGGKIVALLSSLPQGSVAIGGLKHRDESGVLGTQRESALLRPENNFYKMFATEVSRTQTAVDLFLFPSQYCDLAALSTTNPS